MALSKEPRGSVFMSDARPPGEYMAHGWRGMIFGGGGTLWRGDARRSRSEAYHDLIRANQENEYGAALTKPIPDDAE